MLIDTARAVLPESKRESLTSLTKFVDQLPSVLNQVTYQLSTHEHTFESCCFVPVIVPSQTISAMYAINQ